MNENGFSDQNGNSYPDEMRFLFLGTLSAAPQVTTDVADVPTPLGASSNYSSYFGVVIKSSRILELEALFKTVVGGNYELQKREDREPLYGKLSSLLLLFGEGIAGKLHLTVAVLV